MRDLIACLWIWLGPGICRTLSALHRRLSELRRRPTPPAYLPSALPPAPDYARRLLPLHVRDRLLPIDGHEFFLRPYAQLHAPAVRRG